MPPHQSMQPSARPLPSSPAFVVANSESSLLSVSSDSHQKMMPGNSFVALYSQLRFTNCGAQDQIIRLYTALSNLGHHINGNNTRLARFHSKWIAIKENGAPQSSAALLKRSNTLGSKAPLSCPDQIKPL